MKILYFYIILGFILLLIVLLIILLITSVGRYADYWNKEKTRADLSNPIVYVTLGDSAAQGIGASSPQKGYVGLIGKRLDQEKNRPVHIINLSKSGAKIGDVLDTQLPQLKDTKPDIITIEIGANDIASFNKDIFEKQSKELFERLPGNTVISDIPFFGGRSRFDPKQGENVLVANTILQKFASEKSMQLVPLYEATKRRNNYPWSYAIDYFHPNDIGYQTWADVFWDRITSKI